MVDEWISLLRPAVMHPFSIAARFHQTGALEVREVSRHFRLHHAQCVGQFADARLATRQ